MCDKIISENPVSLRYVLDQYKTQQMCSKAADDCLTTLKLVPDWFVTRIFYWFVRRWKYTLL